METFQKAFNRERNKLYQSGGEPINTLAGTRDKGYPEYAFHFASAQEYFEMGELNQSLGAVNKAIELSPVEDWIQYAFKGIILQALEMYQEAMNIYEKAIELSSDDIKAYALYAQIGDCCVLLEKDKKAVEFYSYAIELKKQHPTSADDKDSESIEKGFVPRRQLVYMYFNRANACFSLEQLNEAEKDCFRALEIDPDYSGPCLLLYHLYRLADQDKKAMEFLKKSVELGNPEAQRVLSDRCLGNHAKANNLTEKERAEVEECLNVTFVQQNFVEGKKRALKLINKGRNDLLPYLCLATIYEAEENWKECESISKTGLKLWDENPLLLNLVGVAICNQGVYRISEGLTWLKKGALAGDEKCSQNYEFWKSAAQFSTRGLK